MAELPNNDHLPENESGAPPASETPTGAPETVPPEQQLAVVKDLLLRKAAEFENYKRRSEQDAGMLMRIGKENLVLAFLPVLDDLERSLKAGKDQQDPAGFYKGVELILQKSQKMLEAQGVRPFETVRRPFDVEYHDALLQVQRPDVAPHTVLEEVERGYMMHGKVIRHAKVIVAAGETNITAANGGAPEVGGEAG